MISSLCLLPLRTAGFNLKSSRHCAWQLLHTKKTSPSQWAHLHYQQDNQAVIGGRNGRNRRKKELNKSNATGVEADLRIGA
jgi:hypothetical protein